MSTHVVSPTTNQESRGCASEPIGFETVGFRSDPEAIGNSKTSSPRSQAQLRVTPDAEWCFDCVCQRADGPQLDSGTVDTYGHLVPGANVSYVDRSDREPVI